MNRFSLLLLTLCAPALTVLADPGHHPPFEPNGKPLPQAITNPADYGTRLIPVSLRQRFNRDLLSGIQDAPTEVVLHGWRGETVQAQLLVESPKGFQNLIGGTASGKGSLKLIRYTTGKGVLLPDIVDDFQTFPLPGVVRPLLLTYQIPATAQGVIKDTVNVFVNGTHLQLPVTVHVEEATLPTPANWAFHLDLWQHPDAVARWHDVPLWSPEHLMLLRPQMRYLADMGQKTITCTLINEAWQEQTHDYFHQMVLVFKNPDGSWQYNYAPFDAWVTFARETIGMRNATINCYTMIPWSLTFAYTDLATHTVHKPKLVPGTPEYEAFWGPFLTDFVRHLKEKGWLAQTRLAMDERPDHLLRPALEVARRYAPELQIVAACDRPSAINRDFADVSYAYDHCEQLIAELPERKEQGKTTTFYTCLHPVRPNTLMYSDLAESEWLIPMATHYGLDGMLRWAFHSWEANPFMSMDHVRFPSGDTALMYPGNRPSLRLVVMRNGIESFEKIRLLKEEATRLQRQDVLNLLNQALAQFTVSRGKQQGIHEADLVQLDKVLFQATSALTTPLR